MSRKKQQPPNCLLSVSSSSVFPIDSIREWVRKARKSEAKWSASAAWWEIAAAFIFRGQQINCRTFEVSWMRRWACDRVKQDGHAVCCVGRAVYINGFGSTLRWQMTASSSLLFFPEIRQKRDYANTRFLKFLAAWFFLAPPPYPPHHPCFFPYLGLCKLASLGVLSAYLPWHCNGCAPTSVFEAESWVNG